MFDSESCIHMLRRILAYFESWDGLLDLDRLPTTSATPTFTLSGLPVQFPASANPSFKFAGQHALCVSIWPCLLGWFEAMRQGGRKEVLDIPFGMYRLAPEIVETEGDRQTALLPARFRTHAPCARGRGRSAKSCGC